MAHLFINNIGVDCSSSEFSYETGGEVVRSFNGRPRSTSRYRARQYRFTTDAGGLLHEHAERLRALIRGDGHSWSFDGSDYTYSSRKLVPTLAQGVEQAGGEGYWDSGLRLLSGFAADIRWNLSSDADWKWDEWTWMYWRFQDGEWHFWIRTSSGGSWRDGAAATAPTDTTLNFGTLRITAPLVDYVVDDLVALPYAVPPSWVPALNGMSGEYPFPALPYVLASGPGVPDSYALTALGEVGQVRRVPGRDGSTFVSKDVFDFALHGL